MTSMNDTKQVAVVFKVPDRSVNIGDCDFRGLKLFLIHQT